MFANRKLLFVIFSSTLLFTTSIVLGQEISHNKQLHQISVSVQNGNLKMILDYSKGCFISELFVKGKNVLSPSGVVTGISSRSDSVTSRTLQSIPKVSIKDNLVIIEEIRYRLNDADLKESWVFDIRKDRVIWKIKRSEGKGIKVEDMSFPKWSFASLSTWKGGIIDNGGVVWCKYLQHVNDTYGVHTGGTTFWNEETGDGLSIQGKPGLASSIAMKYSHSPAGEFTTTHFISKKPFAQRYELNRFVEKKSDVFAPFEIDAESSGTFTIQYVDYSKNFDRGELKALNAKSVRELMNTTARYGVVDNNIVGGNGWLTNWKCLHEPFFAQIALAVADSNYTNNLRATLDQEMKLAITNEGRVLSRWHNEPGDEMAGTYNKQTGYYETMWGYTIDSQTGYVINVSELFDLLGDKKWLSTHKKSCEKALEWLIKRDVNKNGIFEMMNSNIREKKASDWLDIVWAGYENAFVNAQMYAALMKWSRCEMLLGDELAAGKFEGLAKRLKQSFNKPVSEGGFWLPEKKQYIYWRDDDNSIHGDNLVTPVNFAAIAFGICDDSSRINMILQQIEDRTNAEKLFHWPLCFESFKREEVHNNNWPFPTYENGDIFPTWGYLGVRAYIKYDKKLALKYIKNLLDQYEKDGLSSQRYDRETGKGLGTDILSGICTGITALYSDIYGIQPKWNRLVINPNLTDELNGTSFRYPLRNQEYSVVLSTSLIEVKTASCSVKSNRAFGVSGSRGLLSFYPGDQDATSLSIRQLGKKPVELEIKQLDEGEMMLFANQSDLYELTIHGKKGALYSVGEGKALKNMKADGNGNVVMKVSLRKNSPFVIATK